MQWDFRAINFALNKKQNKKQREEKKTFDLEVGDILELKLLKTKLTIWTVLKTWTSSQNKFPQSTTQVELNLDSIDSIN